MDKTDYKILTMKAHQNAVLHGFHEQPTSPEHLMMLVITEVAELVQADRKGKWAHLKDWEWKAINDLGNGINYVLTKYYKRVEGTVEDEMADIVIRLFDYIGECFGEDYEWFYSHIEHDFSKETITETAYYFVKRILGTGGNFVFESVRFVEDWAKHLNIDLWSHVQLKMEYNQLRPYKHNRKY